MPETLAQVIVREAQARSEANKLVGEIHKLGQKHQLFEGFTKSYEPFSETDQERETGIKRLPPEGNAVQLRAQDMITRFLAEYAPAIDLAAAKDITNTEAFADVSVDGTVLLGRVPVTHILHMEHVLADWAAFIGALPVLDPKEHWSAGAAAGTSQSDPEQSIRAEVRKIPLVLHPPTENHPAQVAVIDETVNAGRWTKVRYSGALPADRKRQLAARVSKLRAAFKAAREEANQVEATSREEAALLANYLLGD
jgi:hypothetical protein